MLRGSALLTNHHVSNYVPDRRLTWFERDVLNDEQRDRMRRKFRRSLAASFALYDNLTGTPFEYNQRAWPPGSRITTDIGHDGLMHGCFDLFGLDVMFDSDANPYILEYNTYPRLSSPPEIEQVAVSTQ